MRWLRPCQRLRRGSGVPPGPSCPAAVSVWWGSPSGTGEGSGPRPGRGDGTERRTPGPEGSEGRRGEGEPGEEEKEGRVSVSGLPGRTVGSAAGALVVGEGRRVALCRGALARAGRSRRWWVPLGLPHPAHG